MKAGEVLGIKQRDTEKMKNTELKDNFLKPQ